MNRSTAEVVIVLLGLSVFVVIMTVTVALIISIFIGREGDYTRIVQWLTSMIDTILGALIGFVAGAAVMRNGKNGNH